MLLFVLLLPSKDVSPFLHRPLGAGTGAGEGKRGYDTDSQGRLAFASARCFDRILAAGFSLAAFTLAAFRGALEG